MLNNIFGYVLDIIGFIGNIFVRAFGFAMEGIMFMTMFICGALGFGIFILFMAFMLKACLIALCL